MSTPRDRENAWGPEKRSSKWLESSIQHLGVVLALFPRLAVVVSIPWGALSCVWHILRRIWDVPRRGITASKGVPLGSLARVFNAMLSPIPYPRAMMTLSKLTANPWVMKYECWVGPCGVRQARWKSCCCRRTHWRITDERKNSYKLPAGVVTCLYPEDCLERGSSGVVTLQTW